MNIEEFSQLALKARQDPEAAKQFEAALEKFRPAAQRMTEQLASMIEKIQPALREIQKWWIQLHPSLVKFIEAARAMPPAYREALMELGERGWYLDGEMGFATPISLAKAILAGQIEETEMALEEHFTARLDAIEADLAAAHPGRARILAAAFCAHKDGLFACSIPVFLTQLDGICVDSANKYFFIRENKRPAIAGHVDQLSTNPVTAAILAPMAEILPISAGPDARGPGFWQLNRHTVIHGESLDYDTKRNSLRAISLLNYASQMFSQFKLAPALPPQQVP